MLVVVLLLLLKKHVEKWRMSILQYFIAVVANIGARNRGNFDDFRKEDSVCFTNVFAKHVDWEWSCLPPTVGRGSHEGWEKDLY